MYKKRTLLRLIIMKGEAMNPYRSKLIISQKPTSSTQVAMQNAFISLYALDGDKAMQSLQWIKEMSVSDDCVESFRMSFRM